MMKTVMFGLLAETSIHPGTGRSVGVVDLPVAREAATNYPVLVGSSLKGALRDRAGNTTDVARRLFGAPDHAGALLVADARLILLPVRSLTTAFRWATCPHLLERYRRDLARAGLPHDFTVPTVTPGTALGKAAGPLFLEERQFTATTAVDSKIVAAIAPLLRHAETRERLDDRIVVLTDDDFAWFVRYALPIQARNVLDDDTKQSTNLWYEETLPPETVLHALLMARDADTLNELTRLFADMPYLQAGGNETVGQGWFAVTIHQPETPSRGAA